MSQLYLAPYIAPEFHLSHEFNQTRSGCDVGYQTIDWANRTPTAGGRGLAATPALPWYVTSEATGGERSQPREELDAWTRPSVPLGAPVQPWSGLLCSPRKVRVQSNSKGT